MRATPANSWDWRRHVIASAAARCLSLSPAGIYGCCWILVLGSWISAISHNGIGFANCPLSSQIVIGYWVFLVSLSFLSAVLFSLLFLSLSLFRISTNAELIFLTQRTHTRTNTQ